MSIEQRIAAVRRLIAEGATTIEIMAALSLTRGQVSGIWAARQRKRGAA